MHREGRNDGLHAAAVVGVCVCAHEVVDAFDALLLEVGCDMVCLLADAGVNEHGLPVALQQCAVALTDVEIRHGQTAAGHGCGGGTGVVSAVTAGAEPHGKSRDDEREQDGDQMVLGLRAAAAFRLGHGMHLL